MCFMNSAFSCDKGSSRHVLCLWQLRSWPCRSSPSLPAPIPGKAVAQGLQRPGGARAFGGAPVGQMPLYDRAELWLRHTVGPGFSGSVATFAPALPNLRSRCAQRGARRGQAKQLHERLRRATNPVQRRPSASSYFKCQVTHAYTVIATRHIKRWVPALPFQSWARRPPGSSSSSLRAKILGRSRRSRW